MKSKEQLRQYAHQVEIFLQGHLHGMEVPEELARSMEYSLMAGGKRLRPALCLAWAELLGAEQQSVMPFAAGLECIHTYSLIHDDLPAMDDDDLRRGRPSCHKKFSEATAILAGDGLLTEAFTLMLGSDLPPQRLLRAAGEVSRAAGARGMVGGQVLDMEYTGRDGVTLEQLRGMHAMKTGALIMSSCLSGAILAGTGPGDEDLAREYGRNIGLAFQVVDDILDIVGHEKDLGKPVGSDLEKGKTTYPSLIGLDTSFELAESVSQKAVQCLDAYDSARADFLRQLALYIVKRVQ